MSPKIELNSLLVSKSTNDPVPFVKYDIEAALDEIESTETETKIKYTFTLISNPKNTRIVVEGFSTIYENRSETSRFLKQDESHIPYIVHVIYQELFSLFYLLSKSMQIPCPAYKLTNVMPSIATTNPSTEPQVAETTQEASITAQTIVNNSNESTQPSEPDIVEPPQVSVM